MSKALVIGFGSTLRGDDAVGARVAETVREQVDPGLVEVIVLHQLGPELAETISHYELVILVDASMEGAAGTVRCRRIQPRSGPLTESHVVDPAAMLSLASTLYGHAPATLLVTVTGQDFGYGTEISSSVESAIPRAVAEIQRILKTHLAKSHHLS